MAPDPILRVLDSEKYVLHGKTSKSEVFRGRRHKKTFFCSKMPFLLVGNKVFLGLGRSVHGPILF